MDYLESNYSPSDPLTVLDLGTGNGHLLFKLYEEGFSSWKMTGIDYSAHSISLARSIAQGRALDEGTITFEVQDFLTETRGTYDLVLDKGTFDAISLSDARVDGKKLNEKYAEAVAASMTTTAKLIVTSCNWTREELIQKLTLGNHLQVHAVFKEPKQTFQFGGKVGSTTSQVVFSKPST